MSGGHYDYQYSHVSSLADDIERDFIRDGKYIGEDWGGDRPCGGRTPTKEYDRIGDASEEERPLILDEIKSLIKDLNACAKRAKELEWYMSGDTGATSYLKRLNDGKETIK